MSFFDELGSLINDLGGTAEELQQTVAEAKESLIQPLEEAQELTGGISEQIQSVTDHLKNPLDS